MIEMHGWIVELNALGTACCDKCSAIALHCTFSQQMAPRICFEEMLYN